MPDLRSASDEQLLRWLDTYPPRQAASMKRLLQFSMLAGAPRGLLDRFLARPGVPPGMANRIVGGTGDVDSAQLAQRLWALGRLVAADPNAVGHVRRRPRRHRRAHPEHAAAGRPSTPSWPTTATAATTSTSWPRRRG